ncbi:MAG: YraN family protein [Omnitrophica WOR_2 bacterium RIFCSPHIGHO2_02_FULL_68_15]|nr:MAG: YraN family protein [Omnitrophica WOR_2 bacterium RIFCSPHIGHO2_02_FULL_68_15]
MNTPGFRQRLGAAGEAAAAAELQRRGYRILERNVRTALGELDLIARQGEMLCFIEVKTRRSTAFGYPQEAVTRKKQWHLIRMAQWYLKAKGLSGKPARFDVVGVLMGRDDRPTSVEVIPHAFEVPA